MSGTKDGIAIYSARKAVEKRKNVTAPSSTEPVVDCELHEQGGEVHEAEEAVSEKARAERSKRKKKTKKLKSNVLSPGGGVESDTLAVKVDAAPKAEKTKNAAKKKGTNIQVQSNLEIMDDLAQRINLSSVDLSVSNALEVPTGAIKETCELEVTNLISEGRDGRSRKEKQKEKINRVKVSDTTGAHHSVKRDRKAIREQGNLLTGLSKLNVGTESIALRQSASEASSAGAVVKSESSKAAPKEGKPPAPKRDPMAGMIRLSKETQEAMRKSSPVITSNKGQDPSNPLPSTWAPLPPPVPELPSERKLLEDKFKALEKKGFGIVEVIRRDKGKLQDLCLLGSAMGAHELRSCVQSMQEISVEAFQLATRMDAAPEMVMDYFTYMERIWAVLKAVLELFCALLDKSISSGDSTPAGQRSRSEVIHVTTHALYIVVIGIYYRFKSRWPLKSNG
jgi:hypothetical protein